MIKIVAIVATLFLAALAFAQVKSSDERRQDFIRVAGVCRDSVNDQRARGREVFGSETFTARVTPDGQVNYFGTAQARFEYERCMAEQGHPLR